MKNKSISILFSGILSIGFILVSTINLHAQKKQLNFISKNHTVEKSPELKSALELQTILRTIASNITPGVVNIDIEGVREESKSIHDPFFQYFFGNSERLQHQFSAIGSGFIISEDGYIFSNWHVVKGAKKIQVTLPDGRTFNAQLIGADTELDIALLKINATNLPVVPLANSDSTQVGDLVVAIGNPFGLSGTFTFGTVSALGRPGIFPGLQRFIQSDVAVNPGNSGGPLLNLLGQAVGINTAIRSSDGGYEGISFAIPINIVKDVANQIITSGTVERGFLGLVPQELDPMTRKSLKLNNEGVLISSLDARGPAAKSGLMQGDIILKVDNSFIKTPPQLTEIIASKNPNASIEIEILRNSQKQKLIVTLGTRPSSIILGKNFSNNNNTTITDSVDFYGIEIGNASIRELQHNGVDAQEGLIIKNIHHQSPFSYILSPGDIIGAINNIPIKNLNDLEKFMDQNDHLKSFAFAIYKNGYLLYRSIELP